MPRSMTLRLSDDQAAVLETVARIDEMSISDTIRGAIERYVAERRADPDFQAKLRRTMELNQRLLDQLADADE